MTRPSEPRGWVIRLGTYLRIFGNPYKVGHWWGQSPESAIQGYERMAKQREAEFGKKRAL